MSNKFSNGLSDSQVERLAILSEELGEAQQCIGKILRHGYESYNPISPTGMTNREELEREVGDITFAIELLTRGVMKDLSKVAIAKRAAEKSVSIERWLHHQP